MPLTPVMVALLRLQRLHVGLQAYRERIARLLKEIETAVFSQPPPSVNSTQSAASLSVPQRSPAGGTPTNSNSPSVPLASSPHAAVSALLAASAAQQVSAPPQPIKDIPPDGFAPLMVRFFTKLLKKLRRAARLSDLLAKLVAAAAKSDAASPKPCVASFRCLGRLCRVVSVSCLTLHGRLCHVCLRCVCMCAECGY